MNEQLRLFVWRDVLSDYTQGVIFALAHDVDEARRVVLLGCSDWELVSVTNAMADNEPAIYDAPFGWHVWGGG